MGDIALDIRSVVLAILGVVALIIGLIVFFRARFRANSRKDLASLHQEKTNRSPLEGRVKYPEVDGFRLGTPLLLFGLMAALAISWFAFAYQQPEVKIDIPEGALDLDEDIETEVPRTAEPPPPPPPPPPPQIEEVSAEEIDEEEEVTFEDTSIDEETVVEAPPKVEKKAAPPPPPPPPPAPKEEKVEEIFKVVEQMPRFPGCENKGSDAEKTACAQKEMLKFLYGNIKYPAIARENGIQGQVVVTFVVEKDGSITDARLLRDLSAGCGEEALRVVNLMNNMPKKWIPGKQRGKPVRVQFNLPVKFRLKN